MDLFLAPHHDDETLFGAFTILRYQPHVIICTRSDLQESRGTGITNATRERETQEALRWLGDPTYEFWGHSDIDPDRGELERRLRAYEIDGRVFAPAIEEDGHEHHSMIGQIALDVFGDRVQPYLTYRRGHGRSVGTEVPFEPGWPARKMRALACYESQIALPSTEYWFLDSTLREYWA